MINDSWSGHTVENRGCALSSDALSNRLRAWRAVSNRALSRRVGSGRVSSIYPPSVLEDLEPLIAAEAECCPSLSIEIRERGEIIEVEMNFPPALESTVMALLDEDRAIH